MKKNFIYDFLHVIPSMLKGDTFEELAAQAALLREYYQPQENGFYQQMRWQSVMASASS